MPGLRPHKLACHSNISNESCKQMMEWQKQNKTDISMSVVKCTLLMSSKQSNVLSLWNNWPGTYPRSASPWALCCVSVSLAKQLYLRLFQHRHPPPIPFWNLFCIPKCTAVHSFIWKWMTADFFLPDLSGKFLFLCEIERDICKSFHNGCFDVSLAVWETRAS